MVVSRETILDEVNLRRTYQQGKYGDNNDDTVMKPNDWIADIAQYATRWRPGTYAPYSQSHVDDFRHKMIDVAALAVAAIESIDRQRAQPWGRTFYEIPNPPLPVQLIPPESTHVIPAFTIDLRDPAGAHGPSFVPFEQWTPEEQAAFNNKPSELIVHAGVIAPHVAGDCPMCEVDAQELINASGPIPPYRDSDFDRGAGNGAVSSDPTPNFINSPVSRILP